MERYFYDFQGQHYWVCDRTRHSAGRDDTSFNTEKAVARCHYVDEADRITALLNADERLKEQARMSRVG